MDGEVKPPVLQLTPATRSFKNGTIEPILNVCVLLRSCFWTEFIFPAAYL